MMEHWSIGALEYWSTGVLEYWSIGVMGFDVPDEGKSSSIPTIQHSIKHTPSSL